MSCSHSFAVCAYGKSPYLKECLDSLAQQEFADSKIYIATSTPSAWLDEVAKEYNLEVFVNDGESGIGQDWNFAYSIANTKYVTIAHQDDVYCPTYAASAVSALESRNDSLIYFSNYGELRGADKVDDNKLLNVKRRRLRPLVNQRNASKKWAKRAALKFGSAICCPSVTFNSYNCPNPPFVVGMKSNLDWATWERLSCLEGAFIYDANNIKMYHRIHQNSTTSKLIATHERDSEDLAMLSRFWPKSIARLLEIAYSCGTASNEL